MIEAYTVDNLADVNIFYNSVVAHRVMKETLTNSRADVLQLKWERPDVPSHGVVNTLLDKRFISEMNKLSFFLYMGLRDAGLKDEAIEILENEALPQRVDHERLMEIDREIDLI